LLTPRTLLSEDEVESISSPTNGTAFSEKVYLQLWNFGSQSTIRYFCNVDGLNEFHEHNVASLRRFSPNEKKHGKSSKRSREVNLLLPSQKGDKKAKTLRLLFLSGPQKDAWVQRAQVEEYG
jgi:hypothetical protein